MLAEALLLLLCYLQGAPKLKVAIVGGGLAGLSTAVELLDQG
jgi:monoamine oxidase